ncbi:MAG: hypothetical protein BAJALOKI2v1_780012 [Promethearchaeota archaeon]|nr:MAG: hypothetical protein BAJALOKI2v1_780012 [Candidatus Lokiarchaeota archaeon]
MPNKDKRSEDNSSVLTIRIDDNVNKRLDDISERRRTTKASVIRDYLEMAKYILLDPKSITSLNKNDLILIKRNTFKTILDRFDEITQIEFGTRIAQFINDLARLQGRINDIEYKLDICEKFGFFPKFIDKERYILFSKLFGPRRFVEAFVWRLITKGDKGDFDKSFISNEIDDNKKVRASYEEKIQPIRRDASHFAFEFANLEKIKEKK